MQIFFALSCTLAVLAVSYGASVASDSDGDVGRPRAEVEAQDAILATSEIRQATETVGQPRAAQIQTEEEIVAPTSNSRESVALGRKKRTLGRLRLGCRHSLHGASCGGGCGVQAVGCGPTNPCADNTVVLHQDVPVEQPVAVPVPVVKIVHRDVPVRKPVLVPVVKVVHVPVPVVTESKPCCILPQPCCGLPQLPCSPCSG